MGFDVIIASMKCCPLDLHSILWLNFSMTSPDQSHGQRRSLSQRLREASGSLKLRITLGSIAALGLSIALTSLVLVSRAERAMLEFEREHEMAESVRTAALLSRRVVSLQRALASVVPQLDAATLADGPALMRFVERQPFLRSMFPMMYVADLQGRGLIYADEKGGSVPRMNVTDRAYFQRTLAEGRPQISEVVRNKLSRQPVVVFTQPVTENGQARAVLAGILPLDNRDLLDGLVESQEGSVISTTTVVTDDRGLVLAHPDRTRVMGNLVNEARLYGAFAAWQALGSPIEPQGLMVAQPGELVSVSGVPGPNWLVWRVRNERALLAPLHNARRDALRVAVILVILFSTVLLVLLGWLLRPLVQLQERAMHLFDGTLAPRDGWPTAGGEIGSLGCVLQRVGSERAELESRNAEVLGQLRSVMRAAPAGIAIVREGRFELVGIAFHRLLGWNSDPLIQEVDDPLLNQPVARIFALSTEAAMFATLEQEAFVQQRAYLGEWRLQRSDGTTFWARVHSKPIDAADVSRGAVWVVDDIDEARAAHEALTWSATHDPLTGLANRSIFRQRAEALIATSAQDRPAAIVFIDLDHFKPINDLAGHAVGDLMLLAVAKAMTSRVRGSDLVARMGGDEFALLLEGCAHDIALRIAREVRDSIVQIAMPWDQGTLSVGASLGVASLTEHTRDVDHWLEAADAACYIAKQTGRGRVYSAIDPDDCFAIK
ncbi:sensor domain-containing diguanylate cyclase [Variovorax sp. PvP013]|uniref:sensor domain-containing diguanylate cyclase n=1 Tax=Variovorax sp. PvP013 TaxID=3156435 RepID=UPI003D21CBFA